MRTSSSRLWGQRRRAGSRDRPAGDLGEGTGTTVCIVDPYLAGARGDGLLMVSAMLWNFWPKMLPDEGGRAPIASRPPPRAGRSEPGPATTRRSPGSSRHTRLRSRDDRRRDASAAGGAVPADPDPWPAGGREVSGEAGVWASSPPAPVRGPGAPRRPHATGPARGPIPRGSPTARRRRPIRRRFIADPGVDEIFKASEPPSHDEWRAGILQTRKVRSSGERRPRGVSGPPSTSSCGAGSPRVGSRGRCGRRAGGADRRVVAGIWDRAPRPRDRS